MTPHARDSSRRAFTPADSTALTLLPRTYARRDDPPGQQQHSDHVVGKQHHQAFEHKSGRFEDAVAAAHRPDGQHYAYHYGQLDNTGQNRAKAERLKGEQ